ncbi:MAG: hypothetical protein ABIR91_00705 [Candidatus Saccharimonadales bacterium]
MKRFQSAVLAALVAMIAVSGVIPAISASAASSASLSIVPTKKYVVEPGKSIKDTLIIRNLDEKSTLDLTLRVVDFTFNDDGGTPKLMLAEDAPQTTWSLKPFMKVPQSVSIAPKASKIVDISMAIPAGHGAGSYYSAIVYSSGAADGGNVGLSASGVTLVFTSIPGKVNEDLKLEKFGAYHKATNGKEARYTMFTTTKPENIAYTLKNNGNVTESPVGTITLKHMFGKEQVISDINPNGSLALIGQTRTFTSCIKLKSQEVDFNGRKTQTTACSTPSLWPGMYKAELNGFYGQNGNRTQEIVANATFWYLPWWFVLVFSIAVLVAAYYIWKLVRVIRDFTDRMASKRGPRRR